MNKAAMIASALALLATIVPGVLLLTGAVSHDAVTATALFGTIVWFVATPLWMERGRSQDESN